MPYAEYQGAKVAYRRDGTGAALVLVHGTGGDAESNWEAMLGGLTDEWMVIRPNYSGSGDTVDDGRVLTVEYVAGQIMAAADAAGAETFHLMGFSLGAPIVAWIAAHYPERVRSLILLAGFQAADDVRSRIQFELWRHLIASDRKAMAHLVMLTGFSPAALSGMGSDGVADVVEAILETANWEGMARQIDLDLTLDVRGVVAGIRAPTLVIGCRQDEMVPVVHAERFAAAVAHATYVELDSGHLAPMEQPERLAEVVTDFLRSQKGLQPGQFP